MTSELKSAIKDINILSENELKGQLKAIENNIKDSLKIIKKQEENMSVLFQLSDAMEKRLLKIKGVKVK